MRTDTADLQYIELVQHISKRGNIRHNERTNMRTKSLFGEQMKFDISRRIPLLLSKNVWWKGIAHELIWMLKGHTNIKYLVDNDVHIWDEWAWEYYKKQHEKRYLHWQMADADGYHIPPPHRFEDNQDGFKQFIASIKNADELYKKYSLGELGKGVYGDLWTNYGSSIMNQNGINQLDELIDGLKKDPFDRRHIISAWDPRFTKTVALPPCHCFVQFFVREDEKKQKWLSCQLYQRSADIALGVPFNIASYSLLTYLVATTCDMKPDHFIHTFGDIHIYENQSEGLAKQIKWYSNRKKFVAQDYPTLEIINKKDRLGDYVFDDFMLVDYNPGPKIKFDVVV